MRHACISAFIACAVVAALPARADEILFTNGDRLTGTVLSAAEGKLRVRTAVAGEVTVSLADVRTFATDAPVAVHLSDGTVLNRRLLAGDDGAVGTEAGDTPAQRLDLARIASINPPPPPGPPKAKWTGKVLATALVARGNTDTDHVGLSAEAVRRGADDRVTLGAGYAYGRERSEDGDRGVTTNNWFASGKYDYYLNKKLYLYGLARVERDAIADLDLRLSPSAGLGYQWAERPDFNFSTELGGGWVYEDYANADSEDHFSLRAAYHVDRKLNDRVTVFHNFEYVPSVEQFSDFLLNTDVGGRVSMTKSMFAELKLALKYDAEPAPDANKTDLRYLLSLGWAF